MIKINLLPQKRAKIRKSSSGESAAQQQLALGIAAVVGAGVAVYLLVDMPRRARIEELQEQQEQVNGEIASLREQLTGYDELKAAKVQAEARAQAINRLMRAKVVPAHVLHELGKILTPGQIPTMTDDMAKKIGTGDERDANKQFSLDWDPTHVWLSGFTDANGTFKLEGGAQSRDDVTQLSKRLNASAHFADVAPATGERVVDRETGQNYFRFMITGKVVY